MPWKLVKHGKKIHKHDEDLNKLPYYVVRDNTLHKARRNP